MYFKMITPNGQVYISKQMEGTEKEIGVALGELVTKGGSFQLDNELISEHLIERLLEKEENEKTIINAMRALGYKITKPKQS